MLGGRVLLRGVEHRARRLELGVVKPEIVNPLLKRSEPCRNRVERLSVVALEKA